MKFRVFLSRQMEISIRGNSLIISLMDLEHFISQMGPVIKVQ
jgi:hypothetical protein